MNENIESTDTTSTVTESTDTEKRRGKAVLVTFIVLALLIGGAIVFGISQMAGDDSPGSEPGGNGTSETEETGPADDSAGDGADDGDEANNEEDDDMAIRIQKVLPEPMNGQEAIDALGDNLEAVARQNGKTVEELEDLLLRDASAFVSKNGFIYHRDPSPNN